MRRGAVVQKLLLYTTVDYARCMDKEACLKVLSDLGPSGVRLRNSNSLQKKCFQLSSHELAFRPDLQSACTVWRQCLQRERGAAGTEDFEARTIALLDAANIDGEAGITSNIQMPMSNTAGFCINPPMEDPQSWACDCYDEMKSQCLAVAKKMDDVKTGLKYKETICLRAHYCMNDNICPEWSRVSCRGDDIEAMMNLLKEEQEIQTTLLLRSQGLLRKDYAADNTLDSTLATGKRCK
eukprot:gnl/TRDRNA2_/TRDRNA2_144480_c2_seq1.p1 gnl/TRDRNA2_/TRDRNA2_144480_c2~~gnl/TRDRNA2_/TRDRNA2_144480_c2_seq1.p1  ORF type:complete len:238 (-),score=32.43 gnl/TRDRNA2_/TRDRNA2_144480_c2_seq1:82-795(-)